MSDAATHGPGTTAVLDRREPCGAAIEAHGFLVACERDGGHPGWHHGGATEEADSVSFTFGADWR